MKRRHSVTTALAAIGLFLAGFGPTLTQAQPRSFTDGLFLNVHLSGTSMAYDYGDLDANIDETGNGGGAGIQVGYGFTPVVTLFVGADGAAMENDGGGTYSLAHLDAGVQLNFRSGRGAVPYGVLAFTYREASPDVAGGEVDYSGGGATLGGGIKIFFSRRAALDIGLLGTFGRFTDVRIGGAQFTNAIDVDAASARFSVGLSFFPTGGRR